MHHALHVLDAHGYSVPVLYCYVVLLRCIVML